MHEDAIQKGERVALMDNAGAAVKRLRQLGAEVFSAIRRIIDLPELRGAAKLRLLGNARQRIGIS